MLKKMLLIIFIFAGCSTIQVKKDVSKTGIKGRMVCQDILLKDGYVYIYKTTEYNFKDKPFEIAGPTRDDGYFSIDIQEGQYYIVGRKKTNGTKSDEVTENDYFSYYGGNPVQVLSGKYTFVGLTSIKIPSQNIINTKIENKENLSILQGTVTYQGIPLVDAYIYLYLDFTTQLKGPGFMMIGPTKQDGFFEIRDLPENNYIIIARKRGTGEKAGPVKRGDYFGYYLLNPLHLKNNTTNVINIETAIKSGEIGELDEGAVKTSKMYITGKISNKQGNPQQGVYVFAYTERVIGHKKPTYLSSKTDRTGEYILYVDKPGVYYIGVREYYGDSPKPGELYGLYEKTSDHSVKISDEEKLKNINFIVEPILK